MKALLFLLVLSLQSFAIEGVYKVIIEKQQEKAKRQWSLLDWMIMKKKFALQDQWLALHSSDTYFEFYAKGMQGDMEDTVDGVVDTVERTHLTLQGGMFLRFFGLEYRKDRFRQDIENEMYQASIMLLGSSIQSTSLGGFGGVRHLKYLSNQRYQQPYYGGWLQLYLLPFVGLRGQYIDFAEEQADNVTDQFLKSTRQELTAFIDIAMIRISATAFQEVFRLRNTVTGNAKREIKGVLLGGSLFF